MGSFFSQKPKFNTILSAAVSRGCQNKILNAVNYRLTQVINKTVCVGRNSGRNAIIPPYISLSGPPKPHGLNTASVNWLTLGKFPSCHQKKSRVEVFQLFSVNCFFQPKISECLTTAWNPVTMVMSAGNLSSAVVWLSLGHLSWGLVGFSMTCF